MDGWEWMDMPVAINKGIKVKTTMPHEECWWRAHLSYLGIEPVDG